MSRVAIEVDGSTVENTLRSTLLSERRDVEAEIAKAENAIGRLKERLRFLDDIVAKCEEHHVELHTPEPAKLLETAA